jgi:hypothetical protein
MSSATAVSNLIARYAELIDDGDFAGLGELFAGDTFAGSGGSGSGMSATGRS